MVLMVLIYLELQGDSELSDLLQVHVGDWAVICERGNCHTSLQATGQSLPFNLYQKPIPTGLLCMLTLRTKSVAAFSTIFGCRPQKLDEESMWRRYGETNCSVKSNAEISEDISVRGQGV